MHVFKIYDSEGVVTELRRRHGTEPRSAMLANRGVACQRMLPRLGSIVAALLLASALMAEIPEHLRYATLPKQWQQALDTFRDKPSARGGSAKPFRSDS